MLDTMRRHSKSALVYVFFAIIILVFVFSFGPGSSGCRSGAKLSGPGANAATVNGEPIAVVDFEQTYSRVFRDYQARAGGSFDEGLARTIKLKENVLDQMIDRELLVQAAVRHGIAVSDRELLDELHKVPAFQKDGRFDRETYLLLIERQLGSTPAQFEEEMRRGMLAQKMVGSLTESAKVSDDEVRAEFAREKEKLDLAFVRFNPQSLKAEVQKATDEQVDAFVKSDAARVEEFYKSNSFRFHKPKRVQARHILIKVAEKAPEKESAAAKEKLVELQKKIQGGADFAQVAKESSQDPGSKDKGGDLGLFGPGTMDPAFEKAAMALKAGETSEPVRSRFGWHLIRVEEVVPEENRELKDAQKEIAAELIADDRAKAEAKKKAGETLAQARGGKSLEALWPAEKKPQSEDRQLRLEPISKKPEAEATGPFSPSSDYVPRIGMDANLVRAVLALDEKSPVAKEPLEVNGSFYAVVLKSRERADFKELESKLDEYRGKSRAAKANQVVESFVKQLKDKAKIEKNEALLGPGRQGPSALNEG
jgi:peptidyl-prolyl cis-trans isomerase D